MNQTQEEFDNLQIEQAARGCISGKLREWPCLIDALSRRGITLPPWVSCVFVVKPLCEQIIERENKTP